MGAARSPRQSPEEEIGHVNQQKISSGAQEPPEKSLEQIIKIRKAYLQNSGQSILTQGLLPNPPDTFTFDSGIFMAFGVAQPIFIPRYFPGDILKTMSPEVASMLGRNCDAFWMQNWVESQSRRIQKRVTRLFLHLWKAQETAAIIWFPVLLTNLGDHQTSGFSFLASLLMSKEIDMKNIEPIRSARGSWWKERESPGPSTRLKEYVAHQITRSDVGQITFDVLSAWIVYRKSELLADIAENDAQKAWEMRQVLKTERRTKSRRKVLKETL